MGIQLNKNRQQAALLLDNHFMACVIKTEPHLRLVPILKVQLNRKQKLNPSIPIRITKQDMITAIVAASHTSIHILDISINTDLRALEVCAFEERNLQEMVIGKGESI